MAGSDNPTNRTTRTQSVERLHHRAVLREADIYDQALAKAKKAPHRRRLQIPPDLDDVYPLLSPHLATHDGWSPSVTRSSAARKRHLNLLSDTYGPLVFLRLAFPELDDLPLYSKEMSVQARKVVDRRMLALTSSYAPYTVNLQRGYEGLTHSHTGIPLVFLYEPYQTDIFNAPHGKGGGIDLWDVAGHGVVIGDSDADRERVAVYMARHPDARTFPGNPDLLSYLDGLEAELAHKADKTNRVRLAWERNVRSITYGST